MHHWLWGEGRPSRVVLYYALFHKCPILTQYSCSCLCT